MVRLSRMTDYAVGLMTVLAARRGEVLSAPDLAHAAGLGDSTAGKVLKQLAHAGLVESRRGPGGGYSLDRAPEAVSVGDVVRAVEGAVALTDCLAGDTAGCERADACVVQGGLASINASLHAALDGMTLADMADRAPRGPGLQETTP